MMMMILLATALVSLIFVLIVLKITDQLNDNKCRYKNLEKLFPGPKTVPYFGNSIELMMSGRAKSPILLQYVQKYGNKPFRLWIGSELFIVLSDAEDIQIASNRALSKPEIWGSFKDVIGDNLFSLTDANQMKRHRRRFVPVFHSDTLTRYLPVIEKKAVTVAEAIEKYAQTGQSFNAWNVIPLFTMDVITKTMMDVELDHKEREVIKFHEMNKQSVNFCTFRIMSTLNQIKWLDKLVFGRVIKRLSRNIFEFIKRITDVNLNNIKRMHDERSFKSPDIILDKEDDAMTKYFQAAYKLSLEENNPNVIYDEIMNIIGAGTGSAAVGISYALLMLSIHQEMQDKLYAELYEIFDGNNSHEMTLQDLTRMQYTEQVIKESLRHITVVSYVFRYTECEIKLKNGILPASTNILLFLLGTHYNPTYYPEPYTFNPDNFTRQAVMSRPKCTFVAFSAGPRDCIGRRFAMLEMKIMISTLIRRYKFSTNIKMEDINYTRRFLTNVVNDDYTLFIERRK